MCASIDFELIYTESYCACTYHGDDRMKACLNSYHFDTRVLNGPTPQNILLTNIAMFIIITKMW